MQYSGFYYFYSAEYETSYPLKSYNSWLNKHNISYWDGKDRIADVKIYEQNFLLVMRMEISSQSENPKS